MPDFNVSQLNYTYPGELLEEVIILPAVNHPDFAQIFQARQVKNKVTFGMVNPLGLAMKAYTGCATLSDTGSDDITFYNRTLEVSDLELTRPFCPDDLRNTLYDLMTRDGGLYPDLVGSELAIALLNPLFQENIRHELFRLASFGNTAATGSNSAYFTPMDGLWATLYEGVGAYTPGSTAACTKVITSALNDLSSSNTYTALVNLIDGADIVLKSEPASNKRIYCTQNFFDAYQGYRETATGIVDAWRIIEDGRTRLYFRGIELIPIPAWDSYMAAYPTETRWGGSSKNVRLLYTKVDNHIMGYDTIPGRDAFDAFYDKTERKNFFTSVLRMGFQFIDCRMNAVSLGNV